MTRKVLQAWAEDAAAFATELARIDPAWDSRTFPLAGGHAVLCGAGMYVNRVLAAGLERPLTDVEFDLLESASAMVGVPAAVEVTAASHPALIDRLVERGYVADGETIALRHALDTVDTLDTLASPTDTIVIQPANTDLLTIWQATSALGWGHVDEAARRASDAFARAAAVVDGDGLVLATDAIDGRPLGCASLTVNGDVATLGGMSTVPAERERGVQAALIQHRLRVATELGCEIATTSTRPESASYRNLARHGFEPWFTVTTMARSQAPNDR